MDEFLAGRYQNEKGVQLDVLEDRCKPLIKSILDDVDRIQFAQSIGTTPTKVPGVCFRLCVKILKKKIQHCGEEKVEKRADSGCEKRADGGITDSKPIG